MRAVASIDATATAGARAASPPLCDLACSAISTGVHMPCWIDSGGVAHRARAYSYRTSSR
jgi:hypothetical protein